MFVSRNKIYPPSLVDILIYGSLCINFIPEKMHRELFFVFMAFLMLLVSVYVKPQRDARSLGLMLLGAWGMASVFIHSFYLPRGSFIETYKNFYLMSEGFLYLFAGVVLFMAVTRYLKNTQIMYAALPFFLIPWLKDIFRHPPRITFICALIISVFVYLFPRYRIISIGSAVILGLTIFMVFNHKFDGTYNLRPFVVEELSRQISAHPFVGTGYNKTLSYDNMLLSPVMGWVYRHNDFLSIATYIGIPALVFLVVFIGEVFFNTKGTAFMIIPLAFVITCFCQMTAFYAEKALAIIILTGWSVVKSKERYA
jgi:hypothetical protein